MKSRTNLKDLHHHRPLSSNHLPGQRFPTATSRRTNVPRLRHTGCWMIAYAALVLNLNRPIPRDDLARSIICRRGREGEGCRLHSGQNVRACDYHPYSLTSCSLTFPPTHPHPPRKNTTTTPRAHSARHPTTYSDEETKEGEPPHGHVTSISVLRSYRRLGIAKKLMLQSRS